MTKEKFSIVIPTMWQAEEIQDLIRLYTNNTSIVEIIVIDNNPKQRKNLPLSNKLKVITNGTNNFVNPSWNLGYTLSKYNLILSNDDIIINNLDSLLNAISNSDYDLLGVEINLDSTNIHINEYNKEPTNSFGSFIYVKNYKYIPSKYKIWAGDNFLMGSVFKVGILKNSGVFTKTSVTLNKFLDIKNNIAQNDRILYLNEKNKKINNDKLSVLVVLVNFGIEQLNFLEIVVNEIKTFKKYNTKIILHSNIPTNIKNIDETIIFNNLDDYQLLPLTCRKTIWDNRDNFDIFVFGENDHLFKEFHIDKHIEYSNILPNNRISGLIQYEENEEGFFYPAYHGHYEWDFDSVEIYDNKVFAHFTNLHQATFILTQSQLKQIGTEYDFTKFFKDSHYSKKCKVNTDLYQFTSFKKIICISEFKENIIHHLPNLYIYGDKGRRKNQRSDDNRMKNSILKLMGFTMVNPDINLSLIIPTFKNPTMLSECLNSIRGYSDCEILVGIDGCEETLEYVKKNKYNENIRFFYFDKNNGPYIVRNSLAKISNSDILLFFDSDDIMKENMISEILERMKTNEFVKPMYSDFTNTPNYNITKSNTYGEGVFAIKKELFLSMNGFEPWPVSADSDFMNRLYKNNIKFGYTTSVSFYRRIHPNSLTQSKETGLRSAFRGKYYSISKNKTDFSPLPQLVTSDFYEVFTEKEYNTNNDIESTIEIPKPKDLSPILKNQKTIDYDRINEILGKKNTEPPKQQPKPRITNPPINRNEINEMRAKLAKESIKRK